MSPTTRPTRENLITLDPEIMGGAPVFKGTRVPLDILFDHLETGSTIDEFLDGFPSVTRSQVIAFLEEGRALLVATVS